MNTKKVARTSGVLALAVASVLIGRASTKFTTAPALYVSSSAGCLTLNSTVAPTEFVESSTGNAVIKTAGNVNSRHIYYTSSCNSSATTKAWVKFNG